MSTYIHYEDCEKCGGIKTVKVFEDSQGKVETCEKCGYKNETDWEKED